MEFEIKEDGEIVKSTMKDELIVPDVPNTEMNEFPLYETIGLISCVLGLGVVIYASKKKKK